MSPSFSLALVFILLHFYEHYKSILANNKNPCSFFALFAHFSLLIRAFFMHSLFFVIFPHFFMPLIVENYSTIVLVL